MPNLTQHRPVLDPRVAPYLRGTVGSRVRACADSLEALGTDLSAGRVSEDDAAARLELLEAVLRLIRRDLR